VLDDDVVTLVLEGDTHLAQEHVGRLAHHHGAEELPAEPRAAAGGDAGLDYGDAQVGAESSQGVGRGEAAGAGADDDDVGFGVGVEVSEVCDMVLVHRWVAE
jgi:hypothetical protein